MTRLCRSNEFELEFLELHNKYRSEHGVAPLILNKEICKYSQKWAEALAKKDAIVYSRNQDYGECIYCGWTANPNAKITARDCVDKWYSEIKEYCFEKEPEVFTCSHFTQIIWKNTKELGIGRAKSKSGKLYVVANYYPPGNRSGLFTTNVLSPGANQFITCNNNSPRELNNNLCPPSPCQRSSKNLTDIASDWVRRFKLTSILCEKFEEDFLNAHNEYRTQHGVQPLKLNRKLCRYGEEWARIIAKKGSTEHRSQNYYGENIFYAWFSDPSFTVSGRYPADMWYSEINNYTFNKEPTDRKSNHFTQMIWQDTKELGVGFAKSKDGQIYVVAYYSPRGNVEGNFATKVRPPIY